MPTNPAAQPRPAEGAVGNRAGAHAAARRLGVRRLRGAADRGRRDLERPDRRRRGVSGAACRAGVDRLVCADRRNEPCQPRPAPRRVLGLPARGVSAAADDVRAAREAAHRDRRMPLADGEAVPGARDPARRTAASKCAAAATRRARSSTSCLPPLKRIACSSARCSRRRATGPAIRRTSTIATTRRSRRIWRRRTTTASAAPDGYGIQRLYTSQDREEQVLRVDARGSRARARGLPSLRRGAGRRCLLPEHAGRQLPVDGGDRRSPLRPPPRQLAARRIRACRLFGDRADACRQSVQGFSGSGVHRFGFKGSMVRVQRFRSPR